MRLANETNGYTTERLATSALELALTKIGRPLDTVRWLIAVNDKGRFVPVVVPGLKDQAGLIRLVHVSKVVVVG